MVKTKKTVQKKAEGSNDVEAVVQDSALAEEKIEDKNESITQENGDDMNHKKKSKGKTSKKEEADDSAKEDEESESNQQNGAGDSNTKKKQTQKKSSKPPKQLAEPARKSTRTPKPVPKEGTEKSEEENQTKGNKTKKRTASKSPAKSTKKTKSDEKDYEVEQIVGLRVKNGKKEFKIRWKGYKASDDSWEPEKHLSCQDLITKYLEEHTDADQEKPSKKSSTKSRAKKTKGK